MGRVARSGTIGRAGQDRIRRSVKSYVQNRGGARNAARGSVAGRQTVIRLGSFLSDIARRGVAEAVRGQGLGRFLGQPIDLLIEALARMLLPDGADVDEALARDAGLEALSDLLEDVGAREGSIEQLDRLDRGLAERTIERFVENYIAEHFLHALASKIEADAIQAEHAVAVERQVREYIANTVRLDFSNVDIFATDWTRDDAQRMIDRILEDAYAILEDA